MSFLWFYTISIHLPLLSRQGWPSHWSQLSYLKYAVPCWQCLEDSLWDIQKNFLNSKHFIWKHNLKDRYKRLLASKGCLLNSLKSRKKLQFDYRKIVWIKRTECSNETHSERMTLPLLKRPSRGQAWAHTCNPRAQEEEVGGKFIYDCLHRYWKCMYDYVVNSRPAEIVTMVRIWWPW